MKIKELHHVCIQTSNYEESLDFYVRLLGFKIIKESRDFHSRDYNTWLRAANFMIELQTPKKGTAFLEWSSLNSGPVHICIVVDDVKKVYEYLKSQGYRNFKLKNGEELYYVVDSYIFKVRAPEGTEIEVRDNPNIE